MTLLTCDLIIWLIQILKELKFEESSQMHLVCDNQVVLDIVSNLIFHERSKHIGMNCHFIREKI